MNSLTEVTTGAQHDFTLLLKPMPGMAGLSGGSFSGSIRITFHEHSLRRTAEVLRKQGLPTLRPMLPLLLDNEFSRLFGSMRGEEPPSMRLGGFQLDGGRIVSV